MKTVQEYFRELNECELINYYFYKYPIDLYEISNEMLTVKELKRNISGNLKKYIERLRNMDLDVTSNNQERILFYHEMIEDGFSRGTSSIVYMSELLEKEDEAEIYDYMFTQQSEILGFYVAEIERTQENIIPLLVDVMHTASIFGFGQESLQREILELEERAKKHQSENNTYYSIDEIRKELGLKIRKEDPQEEELRVKVIHATFEYNQYCIKKELRELIDNLKEN